MAEEGLAVPEFGVEEVFGSRSRSRGGDERAPLLVGSANGNGNGNGKGVGGEERGGRGGYGSLVGGSGSGSEEEEGKDIDDDGKISASEGPPPVSRKRLITILCALWVGTFLAALDQTLLTTLLPPISTSFSSTPLLSWLATSYLISTAALQPLFGKLTDIFSRRTGLFACNLLFLLGTLQCGLATSAGGIIAGRVVAGMGGGGLTTIAVVTVSDVVGLRERGLVQGVSNVVFGIGSGVGGVWGGWATENLGGWRWAFLAQVPVVIVSMGVVAWALDGHGHPPRPTPSPSSPTAATTTTPPSQTSLKSKLSRVDFPGSITLVTALTLLLTALNTGGNLLPWSHPLIPVSLSLSGVFLAGFVYIEKYVSKEPIIPITMMMDKSVVCACLVNWFMVMAVYAVLFFLPTLHLLLPHPSPTLSGLLLSPFSFGIPIGSLASGLLLKTSSSTHPTHPILLTLLLLTTLSTPLLLHNPPTTTPLFTSQILNLLLLGAAYGGILTTMLVSLLATVPRDLQAVVTSASYAFRSTGSAIGVAVAGAVFQNLLASGLERRLGGKGEEAEEWARRVRERMEEVKDVPEQWRGEVVGAFVDALGGVWWFVAGAGTVAVLCGLGVRRSRLGGGGGAGGERSTR